MTPLTILHRDDHYVAVDKPTGVPVHRGRDRSGRTPLLQRLRDQLGQWVYPIHRLDQATSGVILFGLDPEAAGGVGRQFEARTVTKEYLAVVRGWPAEQAAIDYPLAEEDHLPRQPALTRFRRLATIELPIPVPPFAGARYALVEVVPETGRMHQIRKHFKHISHPLIGDTTYGKGEHNRLFRTHYGIARLLLLARRLRFDHPYTGAAMAIEAPLPEAFTTVLDAFGWPPP